MSENQSRQSWCRSESDDDGAGASTDPRVLLASIVHDFNNFLTPIISTLEDLQQQEVVSPKHRRRVDGAIFCAFRARTLVRQLLDFAHPRSPRLVEVDVNELLGSLEPALASILPAGVSIRFDVADDLPRAFIDPHLIERALLNLVLNARDAMPDGGDVVVSAVTAGRSDGCSPTREPSVRLSVADTGIGMNLATLRVARSPYFSTKANGTGLGLAMVSQQMESQGGDLSVASTPLHGTKIDLWLPVVPSFTAGSRQRSTGKAVP